MKDKIMNMFKQRFHAEPDHIICSPGRVNLIGEHTDYNDGFVLPMALEQATWLALRPRTDQRIILVNLQLELDITIDLPTRHATPTSIDSIQPEHYVEAVAWVLAQQCKQSVTGFDAVVISDVPMGAGLSSSASFELAIAKGLVWCNRLDISNALLAQYCQQAENQWVGVNCGIMDQLICAIAEPEQACLIDCRHLQTQTLTLPTDTAIVVMDTATWPGRIGV